MPHTLTLSTERYLALHAEADSIAIEALGLSLAMDHAGIPPELCRAFDALLRRINEHAGGLRAFLPDEEREQARATERERFRVALTVYENRELEYNFPPDERVKGRAA